MDSVCSVSILPLTFAHCVLISMVYRPLEVAKLETDKDIPFEIISRLWNLVLISNKYGFVTVEIWSFNLLVKHCTKEGGEKYMTECSETDMRLLLEVCSLNPKKMMSDSAELLVKVKQALQQRAKDKEHQHPIDIAQALKIAGQYKLRDLQGLLYYDVLQQATMDAFQAQQDLEYTAFLPAGLSDDHHQAIFRRGFMHLWLTSERIFRDPWDELGQCPCGTNSSCSESARVTVKAALGQSRGASLSIDVLGMLAMAKLRDTLSRQHGWSGVAAGDCEERLTQAVAAREAKLRTQLGDIFLGAAAEAAPTSIVT